MTTAVEKKGREFNDISSLSIPQAVKEGIRPTAFVLLGFWAGKKVALSLQNISNTPTVQGILGGKGFLGVDFNKAIPSVGTALIGLSLSQLAKSNDFKMLGWGAAAAGIHTAAIDFFNKDILSGVDDKTRLPDYRDSNILFKGTTDLEEALPEIEEAMELIEDSIYEDSPANIQGASSFANSFSDNDDNPESGTDEYPGDEGDIY